MPASPPRSTEDEHNHHDSLLRHQNCAWTPPDTDSESTPSLSYLQWPNHFYPRASQHDLPNPPENPNPNSESGCGHDFGYDNTSRHELPSSLFQLRAPGETESMTNRNSALVTAALSPLRSNRRNRNHHLRQHRHEDDTGTSMSTVMAGRKTPSKRKNAHEPPLIPSLSSSSRSNRIYVRIKRVVKEQTTKPPANCDRDTEDHYHRYHRESKNIFSSSSSTSGRFARKQNKRGSNGEEEMIGYSDRTGKVSANGSPGISLDRFHENRLIGGIGNSTNFLQLSKHYPSNEKLLMTQRLLDIETGPIGWSWIEESSRPPESFVWHLASVLTESVQVYLEHNTGKEYWIKHVSFWSDLLDPDSHWWNTSEGSLYKGFIKKLYTSLHRRWGGSNFIEFRGDTHVQTLFVRACILFARKSK